MGGTTPTPGVMFEVNGLRRGFPKKMSWWSNLKTKETPWNMLEEVERWGGRPGQKEGVVAAAVGRDSKGWQWVAISNQTISRWIDGPRLEWCLFGCCGTGAGSSGGVSVQRVRESDRIHQEPGGSEGG